MADSLELKRKRAKAMLLLDQGIFNPSPVQGDVTAQAFSNPYVSPEQEAFRQQSMGQQFMQGAKQPPQNLYRGLQPQAYPNMGAGDWDREQAKKARYGQEAEQYQRVSKGSLAAGAGELASDLALTLGPASAGAGLGSGAVGGLGAGLASTAIHQVQRQGRGQDFEPISAGLETGISAAIPGGLSVAGKFLKKQAPEMLRSSIKPVRKYMDSVNPPNFEVPLDKKLVTKFGGLEKAEEKTSNLVGKLAEKKDKLISDSDINVNITDATRKVVKKLNDMVKNAEIDLDDAQKAIQYRTNAIKGAKKISRSKEPYKSTPEESSARWKKIKDQEEDQGYKWLEEEEQRQAYDSHNELLDSFGVHKKEVQKMANYVKKYGEKKNKGSDLLVREHIPKGGAFENTSDELAQVLGMDEGSFMDMLQNFPEQPAKFSKYNVVKGSLDKPGKYNKVSVTGGDAVKIRKLADQNSKFNPFKGPAQEPAKVVYNEAYRRVLEDEIENELFESAGIGLMSEYKALKKQMADLIPFQKAVQYRLGQLGNNYKLGLLDFAAMGVGGALGGLPTVAAVGGLRRLTSTPGGASMLYDAGKRLTTRSPLGQLGMQGARSGINTYMGE